MILTPVEILARSIRTTLLDRSQCQDYVLSLSQMLSAVTNGIATRYAIFYGDSVGKGHPQVRVGAVNCISVRACCYHCTVMAKEHARNRWETITNQDLYAYGGGQSVP